MVAASNDWNSMALPLTVSSISFQNKCYYLTHSSNAFTSDSQKTSIFAFAPLQPYLVHPLYYQSFSQFLTLFAQKMKEDFHSVQSRFSPSVLQFESLLFSPFLICRKLIPLQIPFYHRFKSCLPLLPRRLKLLLDDALSPFKGEFRKPLSPQAIQSKPYILRSTLELPLL